MSDVVFIRSFLRNTNIKTKMGKWIRQVSGHRHTQLSWSCMVLFFMAVFLSACTSTPQSESGLQNNKQDHSLSQIKADGAGREIVMYSLGLLDVGYRFGGTNPEAGLDCSGMVRFIYKEAVGVELPHNAVALAKQARPVTNSSLRAGDLVFFNTRGYSFSHVGIYLGDNKFIHAPSSHGKIKIESLDSPYFAQRYQGGRTLFSGG
ncbi:MAG: C40 family peptidase [Formivibrio sp.]|nr:C40 family peptidase [Formivibrio sp.]